MSFLTPIPKPRRKPIPKSLIGKFRNEVLSYNTLKLKQYQNKLRNQLKKIRKNQVY